jgi:SNF2 family DNA or RNA helicase
MGDSPLTEEALKTWMESSQGMMICHSKGCRCGRALWPYGIAFERAVRKDEACLSDAAYKKLQRLKAGKSEKNQWSVIWMIPKEDMKAIRDKGMKRLASWTASTDDSQDMSLGQDEGSGLSQTNPYGTPESGDPLWSQIRAGEEESEHSTQSNDEDKEGQEEEEEEERKEVGEEEEEEEEIDSLRIQSQNWKIDEEESGKNKRKASMKSRTQIEKYLAMKERESDEEEDEMSSPWKLPAPKKFKQKTLSQQLNQQTVLSMKRPLMKHQTEGTVLLLITNTYTHDCFHDSALNWMVELEKDSNYTAMMLADDMGLGKTTTSISVCVTNSHWPTLVFCPNGMLVYNWQDEIKASVKGNSKILAFASVPEFSKIQDAIEWRNYHFIILTYDFLHSDKWQQQVCFQKLSIVSESLYTQCAAIEWGRIIFDELHTLKGSNTRLSKAAKKLDSNVCIGLTGSPINNTAAEFENLVRLLARSHHAEEGHGLKMRNVSHFVKRRLKTDLNPETRKTLLHPTPGNVSYVFIPAY